MGAPIAARVRQAERRREEQQANDFNKERQEIRDEYYAEAMRRLRNIAAGNGRGERSLTNITAVDFQNKPRLGNGTSVGPDDERLQRLRERMSSGSLFGRIAATIAYRTLLGSLNRPSAPPTAVTESGTLGQVPSGSLTTGTSSTTTRSTKYSYVPSGSATKYMTTAQY